MVKVNILKNGEIIKQFTCPPSMQQKYFAEAMEMAGEMWNGEDKFTVRIDAI